MKYLRLALVVFASAAGFAYAQDEERRAPPTEIPDFSNLDEYIYEPKSTAIFGFRYMSGAKTSFSGQGRIAAPENPGPATGIDFDRQYHNGVVGRDQRFVPRLDGNGDPVRDPEGTQAFDRIAPDGKTNNWTYLDSRQLTGDGFLAFNSYSADIVDTATREKKAMSTAGLELSVSRDMGKLFGSRVAWNLTAGVSMNDISSTTTDKVRANLNTLTDYYSLFGQNAPAAPGGSPVTSTETATDANGVALTNPDGTAQTINITTNVLINSEPLGRETTTVTNATSVTNRWKLKGAYYTFRAGPTFLVPIGSRFRATFSVGAALVYAGTTYTVGESFTPEIGAEISQLNFDQEIKVLPGYYADATLQFDLTDRAGFYAGAIFQSTGSYDQKLETTASSYLTKVDLSNQNGLRAGMTIRF